MLESQITFNEKMRTIEMRQRMLCFETVCTLLYWTGAITCRLLLRISIKHITRVKVLLIKDKYLFFRLAFFGWVIFVIFIVTYLLFCFVRFVTFQSQQ